MEGEQAYKGYAEINGVSSKGIVLINGMSLYHVHYVIQWIPHSSLTIETSMV